jgi:hypothetical protein
MQQSSKVTGRIGVSAIANEMMQNGKIRFKVMNEPIRELFSIIRIKYSANSGSHLFVDSGNGILAASIISF